MTTQEERLRRNQACQHLDLALRKLEEMHSIVEATHAVVFCFWQSQ